MMHPFNCFDVLACSNQGSQTRAPEHRSVRFYAFDGGWRVTSLGGADEDREQLGAARQDVGAVGAARFSASKFLGFLC